MKLEDAQMIAEIADALVARIADLEATVAGLKSELALQRQTLKTAVNLAGGVRPAGSSIKALPRISRPGVVG